MAIPTSKLVPIVVIVGCAALGQRLNDVWHVFLAMPAHAEDHAAAPAVPAAAPPAVNAEAPKAAPPAETPQKALADDIEEQGDKLPEAHNDSAVLVPSELTSAEIGALQDLAKRRGDLERRDQELDTREALIAAAEQRVSQKVTELQSLKTEITTLLHTIDDQQKARVASLVKIYGTMKPRDAAAVLEGLDVDVALDVLEQMKETKTAPILAAMNPQKASEITVKMMKRQKLPEIPAN